MALPPFRPGLIGWIVVFAIAVTGLVLWLASGTGGLPDDDAGQARIVYGVALVAVIAAGLVHGRSIGFKGALGAALFWVVLGAFLLLGYSYRFEAGRLWDRVAGELIPDRAREAGPRSLAVRRAADGHFYVTAELNGTRVRFLIDTGASQTVLDPRDAQRIGIDPGQLAFTQRFRTANGFVRGAPVTVGNVIIGPAHFTDLPASVNAVRLGGSLMGVAWLERFRRWQVEDGVLTLDY
jgi:aspartyl protease family protein